MESTTGRTIFAAASVLVAIGLVSIASAMAGSAAAAGESAGGLSLYKRELVLALVAFAAFLVVVDLDYRSYERLAPVVYAVAILLLALVLVPGIGIEKNGQRRWFQHGPLSFQPSEFAKFAVVLAVARYATRRGALLGDFWRGLIPGLAIVALPAVLIGMEVDFGTALFVAGIGVALLMVAGGRLRQLVPLVASGVPIVAWLAFTRLGHVRQRVEIFLHPETDTLGRGHQVLQSLISLGNGGVTGLGLGLGRQKRFFLPEKSTDFIFSSFGEEVGFVGCLLVLALFAFLLLQGARVSRAAPDSFGALVALGITLVIAAQAAANVAVVTAVVPTKGIALPFVSRGGSQLVVMMGMVAVLVNVAGAPLRRGAAAARRGALPQGAAA